MEKQRVGNVVNIDLKQGKVHLVYGNHSDRQKFPKGWKLLVHDSDALVLECVSRLESESNYLNSPYDFLLDILHSAQYQEIFLDRRGAGKPLYILDAMLEFENERKYNDFLRVAEPVLGSSIFGGLNVADLIKKWRQNGGQETGTEKAQNTSRRNVLKGLAGLGMAWAVSQPAASHGQNISYRNDAAHGPASEFQKFSQKLHPELDRRVVRYRNLLMAYKLIRLLEHEKTHDVTMVVGLAHIGIEDILTDYQEGKISLLDMEIALKKINSTIHSPVFHTVGKFVWDVKNARWEISSFDINELK